MHVSNFSETPFMYTVSQKTDKTFNNYVNIDQLKKISLLKSRGKGREERGGRINKIGCGQVWSVYFG